MSSDRASCLIQKLGKADQQLIQRLLRYYVQHPEASFTVFYKTDVAR